MAEHAHPHWGIEFDWLAVDRHGHVALFSTAGYGTVPRVVLDEAEALDAACGTTSDLPILGQCDERPDRDGDFSDWVAAAERGLFGFDWNVWNGPYVRLTTPAVPVVVQAMPAELRQLAQLVRLDLDFAAVKAVDLEQAGVSVATQDGPSVGPSGGTSS